MQYNQTSLPDFLCSKHVFMSERIDVFKTLSLIALIGIALTAESTKDSRDTCVIENALSNRNLDAVHAGNSTA